MFDILFTGFYQKSGYLYGPDGTLTSSTEYSPSILMLPSNLTPGYFSTSSSTVTTGPTSTGTLTREVTVGAVETVTVPAGTFSAVKITLNTTTAWASGSQSQNTAVRWFVKDVGWVKSITYSGGNSANAVTSTLSSYSIKP